MSLFLVKHPVGTYTLIFLIVGVYLYDSYNKLPYRPIVKIIIDGLLLIGILINVMLAVKSPFGLISLIGHIPVFELLMLTLLQRGGAEEEVYTDEQMLEEELVFDDTTMFADDRVRAGHSGHVDACGPRELIIEEIPPLH